MPQPLIEWYQKSKFSVIVLGVFAFFGFLSSAVTVAQYFSDGSPNLVVKRQAFNSIVPQDILDSFGTSKDPGSIGNFANHTEQVFCTILNEEDLKNRDEIERHCADAKVLKAVPDYLHLFDGSSLFIVYYKIENKGGQKASGLKFSDSSVLMVEDTTRGEGKEIDKTDSGEFLLPDVNPGQEINIYAWVSGWIDDFDDPYYSTRPSMPKLLYEGSNVDYVDYYPVRTFYYDIIDFFEFLWWPFRIVFVLLICILVTGITVLFFQLVDAILKGKPISNIFKDEKKYNSLEQDYSTPTKIK